MLSGQTLVPVSGKALGLAMVSKWAYLKVEVTGEAKAQVSTAALEWTWAAMLGPTWELSTALG